MAAGFTPGAAFTATLSGSGDLFLLGLNATALTLTNNGCALAYDLYAVLFWCWLRLPTVQLLQSCRQLLPCQAVATCIRVCWRTANLWGLGSTAMLSPSVRAVFQHHFDRLSYSDEAGKSSGIQIWLRSTAGNLVSKGACNAVTQTQPKLSSVIVICSLV